MIVRLVVVFALLSIIQYCNGNHNVGKAFDPYNILNVPKSADSLQIRKAYKNLVKEWHPDKNPSPEAQDRFIQIQQAYEILSNDDKRKQYDNQGFSTDANQHWNSQQQPSFYDEFFTFSNEFFNFDYAESSGKSISKRELYQKILPNSHVTPQVLYVYSTFCTQCIITLKTSWKKAAADLEKLGLQTGTIDTTFSSRLASLLGVSRVPAIVVIFREQYSYFKGIVSYENLKAFVNLQLPSDFVTMVTSGTMDSFLHSVVVSDKPRSLLFSSNNRPTLLYSLMAVKHHQFIDFGFVSLLSPEAKQAAEKFHVYGKGPCLLLFKEDSLKPVVTLQSSDMPHGAVDNLLAANHFMTVPRLTSQVLFDDFCPPNKGKPHIQICAILATKLEPKVVMNLRRLVASAISEEERLYDWLKFMFVDVSVQSKFVKSLDPNQEDLKIPQFFLLWKRSTTHGSVSNHDAKFLESETGGEYGFQKLLSVALKISQQQLFKHEVNLTSLHDELAPNLLIRSLQFCKSNVMKFIAIMFSLSDQEFMIFLVMTITMFLSIYSVLFKPKAPHQTSSNQTEDDLSDNDVEVDVAYEDEYEEENQQVFSGSSVVELDPTSYVSLVLRQERGHMTFVFLKRSSGDDDQTSEFINVMGVHARNPKFHLSFLNVKNFMSWYVELRRTSSAQPPGLKVDHQHRSSEDLSCLHSNTKIAQQSDLESTLALNCMHGTVLAINGSKHWYCIFVPRKGRSLPVIQRKDSPKKVPHNFDDETSEGNDSTKPEVEVLAAPYTCNDYGNALMQWMDRVCEGQMPRLYVRQWPGLYLRDDAFDD
uniref:DnaJ homolog subfamily C member 16-like n=1 Tax=Phallusia mammillata TaxID=59560 RepID=A0A6F9DB16_9ASCI|nr:dnaJ homolog subfamily C member 16-like [Phallusia mammillata]